MTRDEKSQIEQWFVYHQPSPGQQKRYEAVRSKARELAEVIYTACPPGADRSAAVRKLRETVMTANAAIALEEPPAQD